MPFGFVYHSDQGKSLSPVLKVLQRSGIKHETYVVTAQKKKTVQVALTRF